MRKEKSRTENFTIIFNGILTDERISFAAKGFMCYLWHLPPTWTLHRTYIMKKYKIGRATLNKIFDELLEYGYIKYGDNILTENNQFAGKDYLLEDEHLILNDSPDVFLPSTASRSTEKPLAANQPLVSTNNEVSTNQTITNTDTHNRFDVQETTKRRVRVRQPYIAPTLEEVISYFKEKGYREGAARKAFMYYEAGSWVDANGNPVKAWKQKMIGVWFTPENKALVVAPKKQHMGWDGKPMDEGVYSPPKEKKQNLDWYGNPMIENKPTI